MIQAQLVVCIIVGITDLSRRLPFIIATYLNRAPSGSLCVQHPPMNLFSSYLTPSTDKRQPNSSERGRGDEHEDVLDDEEHAQRIR